MRDTINISKNHFNEPTPEEKAAFEGRIVDIGMRGLTVDALLLNVPKDVHYEWVHNDPASIDAARKLGFEVNNKYQTTHTNRDSKGTGAVVFKDVVSMIQPKWMQEIIRKKEKEKTKAKHQGRQNKQEEREYAQSLPDGIPAATNKSSAEAVNLTSIKQTVTAE